MEKLANIKFGEMQQ